MCFRSIGHSAGDIASTIAGCGVLMRMIAVCASGVSAFSTGPIMVWNGWLALIAITENATSAEVTGLPSWNTAFLRRFSVSDLPSAASDHFSARYGCAFHLSSKRSGLAKSWVDGIAVATPDWTAPFRRSEEHTSELQSPLNLVCRLLL